MATPVPWWRQSHDRISDLLDRDLVPVSVAVVDSGVAATHPALAKRVESAVTLIASRWGFDFSPVPVPFDQDQEGHGTSVAGLVAKTAPNARLHDIRIFDPMGRVSALANVAGFRHAVDQGYQVICLAAVCNAKDAPELRRLAEQAWNNGQTVVCARRNVPKPDMGFPASFPSCIGVGSTTFASIYDYRYTGRPPIEFIAYGCDVPAPVVGGGEALVDGTSFATAVVAGLCALLLGAFPGLSPFEVRALLRAYACA